MFRAAAIAILCFGLLITFPLKADEPKVQKTPEELVTEGMNTLMQAMKLFLHTLPQFGEPYINDNGDIVIPRLRPEPPKDSSPGETDDQEKRRI